MPLFQFLASSRYNLDIYLNQPIDIIVFDLIYKFGWIPILLVIIVGSFNVFVFRRQIEYAKKLKFTLLAIDVPRMTEQSPKAMENLFAMLAGIKSSPTMKEKYLGGKFMASISFEIVSRGGYTQFLIRTAGVYRDMIEAAIYAQYPDAEIAEINDYVNDVPSMYPDENYDMFGSEYVLSGKNFMPIRTWMDFEHPMTKELKDPLGIFLEHMAKLGPDEQLWLQIIISPPEEQNWKKEGDAWIGKLFGVEKKGASSSGLVKAFETVLAIPNTIISDIIGINLLGGGEAPAKTEDQWRAFKVTLQEREQADAVVRKIAKIGFSTKFRWIYVAQKSAFSKGSRVSMMKGSIQQFAHMDLNKFGMYGPITPNDDYFWNKWSYAARQNNLMFAYKTRSMGQGALPFILNTEELATLWHFPAMLVMPPLVRKTEIKRGEPPIGLPISYFDEELAPMPKAKGEGAAADAAGAASAAKPSAGFPIVAPIVASAIEISDAGINADQNINPESSKLTPESSGAQEIPDAIRVLIEPGVELEDVDLK